MLAYALATGTIPKDFRAQIGHFMEEVPMEVVVLARVWKLGTDLLSDLNVKRESARMMQDLARYSAIISAGKV